MRSASRTIRRTTVLVLCAVALVGCGGQQADPKEYGEVNDKGDGYYGNLMYGCTGVLPDDSGEYVDETLGSQDYCKCIFEGLKETVPFPDAKEFEEAQADSEPGEIEIPTNIAKVQEKCAEEHPAQT